MSARPQARTVELVVVRPVALPSLPNFVRVAGVSVDVADIEDDELTKLAEEWGKALIAHAADRRTTRATREERPQ